MTDRPGFHLPLLLAGSFRVLIDGLHKELEEQGHRGARPVHGFALQAIGPSGTTVSDLGRRLGVSKQAAAKTATALEEAGYLRRQRDPDDARAQLLFRTARGEELLRLSAGIFEELRADWARVLGRQQLRAIEDGLEKMVGRGGGLKVGDLPGWLR